MPAVEVRSRAAMATSMCIGPRPALSLAVLAGAGTAAAVWLCGRKRGKRVRARVAAMTAHRAATFHRCALRPLTLRAFAGLFARICTSPLRRSKPHAALLRHRMSLDAFNGTNHSLPSANAATPVRASCATPPFRVSPPAVRRPLRCAAPRRTQAGRACCYRGSQFRRRARRLVTTRIQTERLRRHRRCCPRRGRGRPRRAASSRIPRSPSGRISRSPALAM